MLIAFSKSSTDLSTETQSSSTPSNDVIKLSVNFGQSPSHGKAGSFEVVSCLNGQALVKMHSSGMENDMASHGRGQLLSANVSTQDEVLTLIRANPGFFAYTWHWRGKMYENKRRLVAWQWNENNHIEFEQPMNTPGSQYRKYTYFLVSKEYIATRQMMVEGA